MCLLEQAGERVLMLGHIGERVLMLGHVGFKRFLGDSLSYPEISEPEHHEAKPYLGTSTATSVGD